MTKKRWITATIAIVLIVSLVLGLALWNRKGTKVEVYPLANIMYDAAMFGDSYSIGGAITDGAKQEVKLKNALVDSVEVESGDAVKKGDVLMRYDVRSYALAIQSDEADIAVKEAALQSAKKDLVKYQSLQPAEAAPNYAEGSADVEEETIDHGPLVTVASVSAPSADLTYNCTPATVVSADFLRYIRDHGMTATFHIYQGEVLYGSWIVSGASLPTTAKGEYIPYELPAMEIYVDESLIPQTSVAPPVIPEDSGESTGEEGTEDVPAPEPVVPQTDSASIAAQINADISAKIQNALSQMPQLYEQAEDAEAITQDWVLGSGLTITEDGASVDLTQAPYGVFAACAPTPYEQYEVIEVEDDDPAVYDVTSDGDENYMYSASELRDMIAEKKTEITSLELEVEMAKIQLEQDRLASETGEVTAKFDGVVTYIKDPNESNPGAVIIKLKGTQTYEVTAYIDELTLDTVKVGDGLNVYSYETGQNFTATIQEIKDRPSDQVGFYSYGSANPNNSYYPVIASLDEDVDLSVGESCGISLIESGESAGIYLEPVYVREDERGSYVLAASDNNRLEKRYVKTGRMMWGWLLEIQSGLDAEDRIAVPYGKNVEEGKATVDADYPSYGY